MRRPAVLFSLAAVVALLACKGDAARKPAPAADDAATAAVAPTGEDPWAIKAAAAPMVERPLLWAAQKDGKTTYLFGTIHLGVNADTQLPAWVKAKLDGARAFAMEADLSAPGLMGAMARTDGGSLRLELGPAHWAKFEEVIGKDVASGVDKMKPFVAATLLEAKFLPMTTPMDSALETRAKNAGKPVAYLEEATKQLALLESFVTAADVKAFLDHLEHAKERSGKMLAAYVGGDADGMASMFEDRTLWLAAGRDPAQFKTFADALLRDRNRSWIEPIEKLHADGGAFVAVGAGHLVGPHSVQNMLADRGYTITRLTGAPGEP